MKGFPVFFAIILTVAAPSSKGQANLDSIQKMEFSGDTVGARAALARAAQNDPSAANLTAYAEFLDRYGDPAARGEYARLYETVRGSGDTARAQAIATRLAALDLLAGDRGAAARDAAAAGKTLPQPKSAPPAGLTAPIPGPMRSFARMAALSPDAAPDDILPALARNVVTNGYEASHSQEALEQTEYLKLVHRYLSQARELEKLAGDDHVLKIESCDSPKVADLIRILGFRMRGGCGSDVVLETVNAARAFLTTDSGFPVNKLEEALRTNRPFTYDYHPTLVPVLFGPEYWTPGPKESPNFIENFIGDPATCRLYLGFSKLDPETAEALRKQATYTHLKAYAHVLDFFGGMFEVRNGKAAAPGGQRSAAAWGELVGVSPDKGGEFLDKLMAKDDGWLCSLYDALARIHGPVQNYLTEPARMKRFYSAVRGRITSPGPARPVFRSNTDMMLLTTRLQISADGKPVIPGGIEVWKDLFTKSPQAKYDGKLTRLATTWKDSDDVLEALFALCRKSVENQPLKIFMALSDVNRNRTAPLSAETVARLAHDYGMFGSQYSIFSESRSLSDKSIVQFLDTAAAINRIHDPLLRADAAGSFQSLISLWQILVRQGSLPDSRADAVFLAIAAPFAGVKGDRDLVDISRASVNLLAGSGKDPQERLVDLLAGGTGEDAETRDRVRQEIQRVLEAQRMPSLDTLFQLADYLEGSVKMTPQAAGKLAARLSEIQIPRPPLTASEKNAMGFGYWTDRHLDAERRINLRLSIEKAAGDPAKLKDSAGQLAPYVRDTLLAFNYAHYAPPGAEIVFTNPVFVRSHDFIGGESQQHTWKPTEPYGSGWPSNGGGRLVGSLSTLPYALAEAEQNFLVPTQTQALIWSDLVPQMVISAKIPSWWNVTPAQIHWVGLHLRYGRELLALSVFDSDLRGQVMAALAMHAAPARTAEVRRLIESGEAKEAVDQVTPSELFNVARELSQHRAPQSSCLLADIRRLAAADSRQINYAAISRAFGTPKPTLANTYEPEMLNLRTFPTLMGYSSRIMAESWESNTLYWAALADEVAIPPSQLNVLIPEWTQKLVERIFASHLEDWPALLKSLRGVGDEVRARSRAALGRDQRAELNQF
jgi:hypothetical protein